MKRIISALLALCMLFLCGCSLDTEALKQKAEELINGTDAKEGGNYNFTEEDFPSISTSLSFMPLGEAFTAAALRISRDEAAQYVTSVGGTDEKYKALVDGETDLLIAYLPSDEAAEYIEKSGVELEMKAIGKDALVFITASDSRAQGVTVQNIRDIYTGKVKHWGEIGGPGKSVIAYQRDKASDSHNIFLRLIQPGEELIDVQTSPVISAGSGQVQMPVYFERSEGAISYITYHYLTAMDKPMRESCKMLTVNGVIPTNESIESGEYPLTEDFYVIIRSSAKKTSSERLLFNWICSSQGRELIAMEGYAVKNVQ